MLDNAVITNTPPQNHIRANIPWKRMLIQE